MRRELKKISGQRDLFKAKIVREGRKNSYKGSTLPTILLSHVRRVSDDKLMCDHLWLNKTKAFSSLDLAVGSMVQFVARVKPYSKGYQGNKEEVKREAKQDFRLSHPTQVKLLESPIRKEKRNQPNFIIRKKKAST